MAEAVEIIKSRNKTLAIIIRGSFGKEGVNFISDPKDSLQVGVLIHPLGHKVKAHRHAKIVKSNNKNTEFIFVISGKVQVDIYDDVALVKSTILNKGDSLVQIRGGHGFKMITPTKMIEVKQGPYYGKEKEKVFI